jgi:hypothetical protein
MQMDQALQLVQQNLAYILFVLLVAVSSFSFGLLGRRSARAEAERAHGWPLANQPLGLSSLYTMGFAHGQGVALAQRVSAPVFGDIVKGLEASLAKLEAWLGKEYPKALFEAEKMVVAGLLETLQQITGHAGLARAREEVLKQTEPKPVYDIVKTVLTKIKEGGG